MIKFLQKLFGTKSEKDIKEIQPIVNQILAEYAKLINLSNDELRAKTEELKQEIQAHIKPFTQKIDELKANAEAEADFEKREEIYDEVDKIEKEIDEKLEVKLDEILPKAFAILKDTARRFTENEEIEVTASDFDKDLAAEKDFVEIDGDKAIYFNTWEAAGNDTTWDMIHYDVQLIGGVVLHKGKIAEMATGEGKTLVATLPVFLNALTHRGVHLVTVNSYLAQRDSEWMGPLYQFHGLSVDCIDKHQPNSEERRKAYNSDITFGTNNEFGFDYLRDNMCSSPEDLVQRKHNYAIIDEVDSVLIDDARTPLIISGPVEQSNVDEMFKQFRPHIAKLVSKQQQMVTTLLAESKKLYKESQVDGLKSKEANKIADESSLKLLRAFKGLPKNKAIIKHLSEEGTKTRMLKTENFYMQDNMKQMHIVTDDLFFVIDEKNNTIELTDKGHEFLANEVSDDKFFILPDIGSEVTNIDRMDVDDEEKAKIKDQVISDYSVKSERVHSLNQLLKAYTLFEKDTEYVVMDDKIKIVDEQTGRILDGRRYSDGLHQAIEAKENVKIEAATQTYASVTLQNFFRMYHKLSGMTGTAETEAKEFWDIYKLDVVIIPTNRPIARDDRNDLIFKTKREKYKAVIDEVVTLVGQGRPVLVGTTSVEISELLSRMLKQNRIRHNVLNAKLHQREADVVAEAGKPGTVTIATNMAGRGTDIKLSQEVKEAGGLAIIGTERHDSRRVDRQLRGRAGRQGDPGSSQFFISLEDNLMRMFGSGRISGIMDRMGLKEGDVIEHSMINKSIERAQKKVEENNFGVRKHLLEYDDVMNSQRTIVYKKRKHALFGERMGVDISNMIHELSTDVVNGYQSNNDYEDFNIELMRNLNITSPIKEEELKKEKAADLITKIYKLAIEAYKRKNEQIAEEAFPIIKQVYETQFHIYKNIVVPITDGKHTYSIPVNLEAAYNTSGKAITKDFEKAVLMNIIDNEWKENLREMDDLRSSVQNAVYEQKDPLLIYKLESFDIFKNMIERINKQSISILLKGNIQRQDSPQEARQPEARNDRRKLKTSREDVASASGQDTREKRQEPVRAEKKIGRNEPCPCGSGKKYKVCHGR
jgi:preprotein translocase subunit SecA